MFVVLLYIVILSNIFIGNFITASSIFRNRTTETVTLNNIEYVFYDLEVSWDEARMFCLGFESELAVLDTEEKAAFISGHIAASDFVDEEFWIGSKINPQRHWVWTATDTKVAFDYIVQETIGAFTHSNVDSGNDIFCLTVFRRNHYIPIFTPTLCLQTRRFICQKNKFAQEETMINAFSTRIENNYFLFFLSKVTWFEAVAQCRIRGFQLAEIQSASEARIIGIKMLKLRPRSVESAWIGGHLQDRMWQWLPSGNNIIKNELWDEKYMISGSCLLLDRHTFNLPTYLSNKCDRKRNFLCQSRTKDQDIDPVLVIVDSWKYWIHFQQLAWYEANEACTALNASLVSFESSMTMKHVTNILRNNRKELRHIWIGGRVTTEHDNFNETVWQWEHSGDKFLRENISWCNENDSRICQNTGDCLNMDIEDYYAPIVYGLDCNIKQAYICQETSEAKNTTSEVLFASRANRSDNIERSASDAKALSHSENMTLSPDPTSSDKDSLTNGSVINFSKNTKSSVPIDKAYTANNTTLTNISLPKKSFVNVANESKATELLPFDDNTSLANDTILSTKESVDQQSLKSTVMHKLDNISASIPSKLDDDDFKISVRNFDFDPVLEATTIKPVNKRIQEIHDIIELMNEKKSGKDKLNSSVQTTTTKSVNTRLKEILEIIELMDQKHKKSPLDEGANEKRLRQGLSKIVEASFDENLKNKYPVSGTGYSDTRLKKSSSPISNLDEDRFTRSFGSGFFAAESMPIWHERNKGPSYGRLENKQIKDSRYLRMERRLSNKNDPPQLQRNSYLTKESIQPIHDDKKSSNPNLNGLIHAWKNNLNEKQLGLLSTATHNLSSRPASNIKSPWNALFTSILHHLNITKFNKKLIGFDVKEIPLQ